MKLKTIFLMILLGASFIFSGCSSKSVVNEYNRPAIYWYGEMINSISKGNLEKADNFYSSLQGEHIGSPLLPEATMILAIAHMHYEEYLLSEHFANEYVKRYANANEREFAEFLKIKAKYRALPNSRRDQVLIQSAIKESGAFKRAYPRSMYYPIVDTMLTNLRMAEALLNENIAELYIRLDKPKSAEYYRSKKAQDWLVWDEIDRVKSPWYKAWFEGDGTESWYAFMIPDTHSVVARNTAQEEYVPGSFKDIKQTDAVAKPLDEESPALNTQTYFKTKDIVHTTKKQENELKKAQSLLDDGILNEEEFKNLKEEILQ